MTPGTLVRSLFPDGRTIFRVAVLVVVAALAGAIYAVTRSQEVYVLMLVVSYMGVQQLVGKTVYGWLDRIYYSIFGRNHQKMQRISLKAQRVRLKAERVRRKAENGQT